MPSGGSVVRCLYSWKRRFEATEFMVVVVCLVSRKGRFRIMIGWILRFAFGLVSRPSVMLCGNYIVQLLNRGNRG
jgi:hypothetical protein